MLDTYLKDISGGRYTLIDGECSLFDENKCHVTIKEINGFVVFLYPVIEGLAVMDYSRELLILNGYPEMQGNASLFFDDDACTLVLSVYCSPKNVGGFKEEWDRAELLKSQIRECCESLCL